MKATSKKPTKAKKPSEPLYVIRKRETIEGITRERELMATTFKDVADRYWLRLQQNNVKDISFTTYE